MSALDQAIIKAYAKDRPAAASSVAVGPAAPSSSAATRKAAAQTTGQKVDQLYRDGSLYRLETPAATQPVPMPHLPSLPPTSPRRGVRRSMQRLLAANAAAIEEEQPAEPPRVARKVIIRHIAHSAARPPLGLLRPTNVVDQAAQIAFELPPETIFDEPLAAPPAPTKPLPAPEVAPLNVALEATAPIEIYNLWQRHDIESLIVLADGPNLHDHVAPQLVNVQLEALEALTAREAEAPARKSREPVFRLDQAHAESRPRPHARFQADQDAETPATEDFAAHSPPPVAAAITEEAVSRALEAEAENEGWPPELEDLTFAEPIAEQTSEPRAEPRAEPIAEALASDLVPRDQDSRTKPSDRTEEAPAAQKTTKTKPALPLWEVDRFHWPRTCEKLMNDQRGYMSRAGDKLLAAVQDGLRVLAITGSRRGEGRTMLSLCLARAAARAGIQAAVMDADFARPQLASKIALEIAFGWQDAALGKIPLSEAAIKSLSDEITVLPLESSAATRSLSLADPRVTATIRAAAATFELLILDLGPLAAGEKIEFPPGEGCPLDAAIVVRDQRFSTVIESETIGRVLHDAGLEAVGIAENFVIEEDIPVTSV